MEERVGLRRAIFILQLVGLFAGYFSSAYLGLKASAVSGFASLIWAPSGLAVASILLAGRRLWPAVFLAAFAINLAFGASVSAALGIGIGNTLEALVVSWLLGHSFDRSLNRLHDLLRYFVIAVIMSPAMSVLFGVGSLYLFNQIPAARLGLTAMTWWVGDALGILLVAPLLLAWATARLKFSLLKLGEASALVLLLLTVNLFLFGRSVGTPLLPYLLFLFVVAASLRFGLIGSTTTTMLISLSSIWGTLHGLGPFAQNHKTVLANLFVLQGFMTILAVTGLILSILWSERQEALTERHRAEADLRSANEELEKKIDARTDEIRRSREFLDSVIENLPNMVFVKDARELRFVRFNKAGEELLGYSRDDLLGKNDFDFFPQHQAEHFIREDRKVLESKNLADIPQESIMTRKGQERILHTRKIPIIDQSGVPVFLLGISEDITDKIQFERQREKEEQARSHAERVARAAEAANNAKSLFVANMSHEIRTPLGVVLGFTNLLAQGDLSPEARAQYSAIILRNGQVLTKLIDDILDLSKIEAGFFNVEVAETSLPSLIGEIQTLMRPRASEKGLEFNIITDPDMPKVIRTDPNRLRQILVNIVGNAVKFTERGQVELKVQQDAAGTIRFTVNDTGIGILPEHAERLFAWFTQADATTTRRYGGTGLGLALSRKLARALGGDVNLMASSNRGSQFVITVASDLSKSKHKYEVVTEKPMERIKDSLKGLEVLLVDDSADNRALVEVLLSREHAKVDCAQNGREGVDMAIRNHYDVILMDVQMPVLDGIEATREIRRRGLSTPIIALTAHAMTEERDRTLAAGCNAHLTKPIDTTRLLNTVAQLAIKDSFLKDGPGLGN